MHPVLAPSIVLAGIGALVTFALIPPIRKLALQDQRATSRRFHHTHSDYVPRLGGIALAVAFVCVAIPALFLSSAAKLPQNVTMVISCLCMFALGVWDDF